MCGKGTRRTNKIQGDMAESNHIIAYDNIIFILCYYLV